MRILSNKQLSISQNVNTIGKFLYKNLDGAFDFAKSSNTFEIWCTVLYQIPVQVIRKYNLPESMQDVNEMTINLNLTTYSDKIRFNIIEVSPNETTLGCKVCKVSKYSDYYQLRDDIFEYLQRSLLKRYQNYDFLF